MSVICVMSVIYVMSVIFVMCVICVMCTVCIVCVMCAANVMILSTKTIISQRVDSLPQPSPHSLHHRGYLPHMDTSSMHNAQVGVVLTLDRVQIISALNVFHLCKVIHHKTTAILQDHNWIKISDQQVSGQGRFRYYISLQPTAVASTTRCLSMNMLSGHIYSMI